MDDLYEALAFLTTHEIVAAALPYSLPGHIGRIQTMNSVADAPEDVKKKILDAALDQQRLTDLPARYKELRRAPDPPSAAEGECFHPPTGTALRCGLDKFAHTLSNKPRPVVCNVCMQRGDVGHGGELDLRMVAGAEMLKPSETHPAHVLVGGMLVGTLRADTWVCATCSSFLVSGERPPFALSRGLWAGDVPRELQGLTMAERLCIGLDQLVVPVITTKREKCERLEGEWQIDYRVCGEQPSFGERPHSLPLAAETLAGRVEIWLGSEGERGVLSDNQQFPELVVRRWYVGEAVQKLAQIHPLYARIRLDVDALWSLPEDGIPSEFMQHAKLETERPAPVPPNRDLDVELAGSPERTSAAYPDLWPFGVGVLGTADGVSVQAHVRWLLDHGDARWRMSNGFLILAHHLLLASGPVDMGELRPVDRRSRDRATMRGMLLRLGEPTISMEIDVQDAWLWAVSQRRWGPNTFWSGGTEESVYAHTVRSQRVVRAVLSELVGRTVTGERVFGKVKAYAAVVEPDGLLKVKLHLLLWNAGSASIARMGTLLNNADFRARAHDLVAIHKPQQGVMTQPDSAHTRYKAFAETAFDHFDVLGLTAKENGVTDGAWYIDKVLNYMTKDGEADRLQRPHGGGTNLVQDCAHMLGGSGRLVSHDTVDVRWDELLREMEGAFPERVGWPRAAAEGVALGKQQVSAYMARGSTLDRLSFMEFTLDTYDSISRGPVYGHPFMGPRIPYVDEAGDWRGHVRLLHARQVERVPVFIGPAFPSREEDTELYNLARVVLFAPWRVMRDAVGVGEELGEVSERLLAGASPVVAAMINNMDRCWC
ncbi:hypothetical protein PLICRDRAFT_176847 [Plicaturopsis crispa FD-325 SS-3]|nr:hypothetical protein PLICRDRAFT_176847 [Plicaturopsis crispa FD-325 SS-3]